MIDLTHVLVFNRILGRKIGTKMVMLQNVVDALSDGLYNLIRVRKSKVEFDKQVYPLLRTVFSFNALDRYQTTVLVNDVQYRIDDYQVTRGLNDLVVPKVIFVRDAPKFHDFKDRKFFQTEVLYEDEKGNKIPADLLSPADLAVHIKQLGGWMRINAALVPLHVEDAGLITEYVKYAIYDDGSVEERTQPAIVKLTDTIDQFNSESYKEWAYTKAQFLIQDGGNNV